MDIAALGFMATDGDGKPVNASCSMGAPTTCDDADPGTYASNSGQFGLSATYRMQ